MLMFYTSTQFNHIFLWWFYSLSSSHLCLTILTSSHTLTPLQHVIFSPSTCHVICLDWTFPLQLLISLPSFIEWTLSYDHLSPLPLLFPLPSLSISLGGPAFLPGFCRPRCENWRWRGRWWMRRRTRRRTRRSGNQRSRLQSLFLGHFFRQLAQQWRPPPNWRPSLSTHSSSTSQSEWRAPWQPNILPHDNLTGNWIHSNSNYRHSRRRGSRSNTTLSQIRERWHTGKHCPRLSHLARQCSEKNSP